jgi:hypothetical protein
VRLPAKTKTELLAKIAETRKALDSGLEVSASYTFRQCLDDFLDSLEGSARKTVEPEQLRPQPDQHIRAGLPAQHEAAPPGGLERHGLVGQQAS